MPDEKNVLQFPRKTAVFTPNLRDEITSRITPHTQEGTDVEQIINSTEDAICHWMVVGVRKLAKKFGEHLGMKIGEKTDTVLTSIQRS